LELSTHQASLLNQQKELNLKVSKKETNFIVTHNKLGIVNFSCQDQRLLNKESQEACKDSNQEEALVAAASEELPVEVAALEAHQEADHSAEVASEEAASEEEAEAEVSEEEDVDELYLLI